MRGYQCMQKEKSRKVGSKEFLKSQFRIGKRQESNPWHCDCEPSSLTTTPSSHFFYEMTYILPASLIFVVFVAALLSGVGRTISTTKDRNSIKDCSRMFTDGDGQLGLELTLLFGFPVEEFNRVQQHCTITAPNNHMPVIRS